VKYYFPNTADMISSGVGSSNKNFLTSKENGHFGSQQKSYSDCPKYMRVAGAQSDLEIVRCSFPGEIV
jgi:hypothetical protein